VRTAVQDLAETCRLAITLQQRIRDLRA